MKVNASRMVIIGLFLMVGGISAAAPTNALDERRVESALRDLEMIEEVEAEAAAFPIRPAGFGMSLMRDEYNSAYSEEERAEAQRRLDQRDEELRRELREKEAVRQKELNLQRAQKTADQLWGGEEE